MSDEKMKAKIAGLLAKAESTDSPEEAEALSAKAEELMLKYSIDEAMLSRAGGSSERIVKKDICFFGSYRTAQLQSAYRICLALGGLKNVKSSAFVQGKNAERLYIIGYEPDVDAAIVLITSLQLQCATAQKKWWKEFDPQRKAMMSGMDRYVERREFIHGFGAGAASRITTARQKAERAYEAEHGEGVLVPVRSHRERAIADFMDSAFGKLGKSRGGSRRGGMHGGIAGRAAGANANTGGVSVSGGRKAIG